MQKIYTLQTNRLNLLLLEMIQNLMEILKRNAIILKTFGFSDIVNQKLVKHCLLSALKVFHKFYKSY